ncbi:MAG: hypothetical protein U0174_10800 [Polyangiaceae bacterium]
MSHRSRFLSFFVASAFSASAAATVNCGSSSNQDLTDAQTSDASKADAPSADGSVGKAPRDPALAARAAAFIGSCLPDDGVNAWLSRIYMDVDTSRVLGGANIDPKCFSNKTNGCAAVKECLGISTTLEGPCAPGCAGSVHSSCDDRLKVFIDCSNMGLACDSKEGCVQKDAAKCDPETFKGACKSGVALNCDYGTGATHLGANCAANGLACRPGTAEDGFARCAGTGPECSTNFYSGSIDYSQGLRCNGTKLTACVNGAEGEVDCSQLGSGFTCQSGDSPHCGLGSACIIGGRKDEGGATCEGTSLVVCNGGRIDKVDCVALGFTGCANVGYMGGAACTPNGLE